MLREFLSLVLMLLVARAIWRVVGGALQGLAGPSPNRTTGGNAPKHGVQMVRDPVCGTYVIRDRAIALSDGSRPVFFCSANCRETYRTRPSTNSGHAEPGEGRTA